MILLTIFLIPFMVLVLIGVIFVIGFTGTVPPLYDSRSDESITCVDHFSLTRAHTDSSIEPIPESFQTQTADMTGNSTPVLYF